MRKRTRTADIEDDNVTYAKIQNVSATNRIMGRISPGAGDMQELSGTDVKAILATVGDPFTVVASLPGSGIDGEAVVISSTGEVYVYLSGWRLFGTLAALGIRARLTSTGDTRVVSTGDRRIVHG